MEAITQFFMQHKKVLIAGISTIVLIFLLVSCYDTWCDMWYEFGQNLYYMLH